MADVRTWEWKPSEELENGEREVRSALSLPQIKKSVGNITTPGVVFTEQTKGEWRCQKADSGKGLQIQNVDQQGNNVY